MNKNRKRPKLLLPKKIKPVSESPTNSNSRTKQGEIEHPLNSTLEDGGVPLSHLTFNLDETLTEVPSQRYSLRNPIRKQIDPIEEESEDEESTIILSEVESDSELSCSNGGARESSESEAEDGECAWLKDHKLSCKKCQAADGKAANLNRHRRRHQGLKRCRCEMCKTRFAESSTLKAHIRSVHEGKKDFICSTCALAFGRKQNLTIHIRTVHEGKKDFTCSTCGVAFGRKGNLKQHVSIHDGTKNFICSECPKSFTHKITLTVHLRIHDGTKPFNCSECPKSFTHKSTLTHHLRIHDGVKPFSCSECQKSFAQRTNLTRHKRIHENDKSFACSSCDKRFRRKDHLRGHEMRAHKENLDEDHEDSDSDSS